MIIAVKIRDKTILKQQLCFDLMQCFGSEPHVDTRMTTRKQHKTRQIIINFASYNYELIDKISSSGLIQSAHSNSKKSFDATWSPSIHIRTVGMLSKILPIRKHHVNLSAVF